MIFRVLILSLIFSIHAYAKPTLHATTPNEKMSASQSNAQPSEDDLSSQLTSQSWQITQVAKQSGFNFDADHWIFNFAKNGKYKAFGTCNFLGGSFKSDGTGSFRISNLDGSNNRCEDGKDEETAIFNMLLLADSYEINAEGLLLKSNGQALIGLKASDKSVNQSVAHKSRSERNATKSHSKKDKKSSKKSEKTKAKSSSKTEPKTPAKVAGKKSSSKHQAKKKKTA